MLELQTICRRFGELFRIVLLKPRHAGNSACQPASCVEGGRNGSGGRTQQHRPAARRATRRRKNRADRGFRI